MNPFIPWTSPLNLPTTQQSVRSKIKKATQPVKYWPLAPAPQNISAMPINPITPAQILPNTTQGLNKMPNISSNQSWMGSTMWAPAPLTIPWTQPISKPTISQLQTQTTNAENETHMMTALLQMRENVNQWDDVDTVISKYPDLWWPDIVWPLYENMKKWDTFATILQKYPELQQVTAPASNRSNLDDYKIWNTGISVNPIKQAGEKILELKEYIKNNEIDPKLQSIINGVIQVTNPMLWAAMKVPWWQDLVMDTWKTITQALLWFAGNTVRGVWQVIEGWAWLLDKGIAGTQSLVQWGDMSQYQTRTSWIWEDVLDIWAWATQTLASIYAMPASLLIWVGIESLPPEWQKAVSDTMTWLWGLIAKTPWLKQWMESLPPERRDEFKSELAWAAVGILWGLKNKTNIYKNPKAFLLENLNPVQIAKNFNENVIGIPSKALDSAVSTVGKIKTPEVNMPKLPSVQKPMNYVAQKLIDSKFKISKTNKDAIRKASWLEPSALILENDLTADNIDDMVTKTQEMVDTAMSNKFKALEKVDTPQPITQRDRLIWQSIVNQAKNDISEVYSKPFDEITPDEIIPELKDQFDIIKNVEETLKLNETTALKLEAMKSLYDMYNSHLKYDPAKKRILSSAEKIRLWLQSDLEKLWKTIGVDIKWLNKKIAGGKALEKWLIQAGDRMDNNNIFWLSDSQTAILWSVLWGGGLEVAWLLWAKSLFENIWIRLKIAKSLYSKVPNDWAKSVDSPTSNRTTAGGNISKQFGGSDTTMNDSKSSVQVKQKWTWLVPLKEWKLQQWMNNEVFLAGKKWLKTGTITNKWLETKRTVKELNPQGLEYKQSDFNLEDYNKNNTKQARESIKKEWEKISPIATRVGDITEFGTVEKLWFDGGGWSAQRGFAMIGGKKYPISDLKEVYREWQKFEDIVSKSMSEKTTQRSKLDDANIWVARATQLSYIEDQIGKKVSELDANSKDIVYRLLNNKKLQWNEEAMNDVFDIIKEWDISNENAKIVNSYLDDILKEQKKPVWLAPFSEPKKTIWPVKKAETPVPTVAKTPTVSEKSSLPTKWLTPKVSKELQPLYEEARKYKSAEEFVKNKWFIDKNFSWKKTYNSDLWETTQYSFWWNPREWDLTYTATKDWYVVNNVFIPDTAQWKWLWTNIYRELNAESIKNTGKPLYTKERTLNNWEKVSELSDASVALRESLVRKWYATKIEGGYRFKTESQLKQIREEANNKWLKPKVSEGLKATVKAPEEALIVEARKYKSAEEFENSLTSFDFNWSKTTRNRSKPTWPELVVNWRRAWNENQLKDFFSGNKVSSKVPKSPNDNIEIYRVVSKNASNDTILPNDFVTTSREWADEFLKRYNNKWDFKILSMSATPEDLRPVWSKIEIPQFTYFPKWLKEVNLRKIREEATKK